MPLTCIASLPRRNRIQKRKTSTPGSPTLTDSKNATAARKVYAFTATQPLRYLAFVVSRFVRAETVTIALTLDPPGDNDGLPPLTGVSFQLWALPIGSRC